MSEQLFTIPENGAVKFPEMPEFNSMWPLMLLLFMFPPAFGTPNPNSIDANKLTRMMLEKDPLEKTKRIQECFQEYEKQFRESAEKTLFEIKESLKNINFFENISQETKDQLIKALDSNDQGEINKWLNVLSKEIEDSKYGNEIKDKN